MRYLAGLQMGYAVLYSTGTRTNTHYNLQLGGETAIMVKDRFVSAYAEPEYTVARRRLRRRDPAVRLRPEPSRPARRRRAAVLVPDMVTQTIHVGDCELLERWADSRSIADPLSMWRTWLNRTLIEGLNLVGDVRRTPTRL